MAVPVAVDPQATKPGAKRRALAHLCNCPRGGLQGRDPARCTSTTVPGSGGPHAHPSPPWGPRPRPQPGPCNPQRRYPEGWWAPPHCSWARPSWTPSGPAPSWTSPSPWCGLGRPAGGGGEGWGRGWRDPGCRCSLVGRAQGETLGRRSGLRESSSGSGQPGSRPRSWDTGAGRGPKGRGSQGWGGAGLQARLSLGSPSPPPAQRESGQVLWRARLAELELAAPPGCLDFPVLNSLPASWHPGA